MKIIYLHHSGFIVELERMTLIFDAITNIPPHFLRKGRKNYFFVTHSHHKRSFPMAATTTPPTYSAMIFQKKEDAISITLRHTRK